jgi:hypothetical protein
VKPEFSADIGQPQLGMLGIKTKENINRLFNGAQARLLCDIG